MSDKSEGPGWWIASDGKWYPPELHPSVRESSRMRSRADTPVQPAGQVPERTPEVGGIGSQRPSWQVGADRDAHVGPQFPDLFEKALQGSHLADTVTVRGIDDVEQCGSFTSARAGGTPASTPVGASAGAGSRRRWRKGR
jgi:hypothetical protein